MTPLDDIFNSFADGQNWSKLDKQTRDLFRTVFMTGALSPTMVMQQHGIPGMIEARKELDKFELEMRRRVQEWN